VSVHVPLLPATRGLIDARALAAMEPGEILIDAARGGIVDEGALVEALRAGRLSGAALDVVEREPLTAEAAKLFEAVPNLYLILTPTSPAGLRSATCASRRSPPPMSAGSSRAMGEDQSGVALLTKGRSALIAAGGFRDRRLAPIRPATARCRHLAC
jgi:hypothetical protein